MAVMGRTQRSAVKMLLMGLLLISGLGVAQDAEIKPLPLKFSPTGVLFSVQAPKAKEVYVAGTFNGWGGSDGTVVMDPNAKMYGPDDNGVFEFFTPLTPGKHTFKFCINGTQWVAGPPDLPRAKDDFDTTAGQGGVMGSAFEFALQDPPWPSYVPTKEMLPQAVTHKDTGQPYLRIRFFSRQAQVAHVVGSWDGWAGVGNRSVTESNKEMQKTKVPNIWEKYIGPLPEGNVEYKIVVNNRQWLSDPSVSEQSQDGNSMVQIANYKNTWYAIYTPRFAPDARRRATTKRWGGDLDWLDDRSDGFLKAQVGKKKMIWVITLPKSTLSDQLMKEINADPEVSGKLKEFICLETSANEVQDILRQRRIYRLPHVVLVNSKYKPVYEQFNPSLPELKAQLNKLE